MSRVCDFTGRKRSIQRTHRHTSGKSRSGTKAFAPRGPQGLRGIKRRKVQNINFVTVKTPEGRINVSMKVYKKYFKTAYSSKVDEVKSTGGEIQESRDVNVKKQEAETSTANTRKKANVKVTEKTVEV